MKNTLMRLLISLITMASCLNSRAADGEFYKTFLTMADTNDMRPQLLESPLLVDTNNTGTKLTNAMIQLDKLLTHGQIADLKFGMTMDEVVARWGKPKRFYSRCGGGPRFLFTDVALVFCGNELHQVRPLETLLFDKGITSESNLKEWTQACGEPTRRVDSPRDRHAYVLYQSVHCALSLHFDEDGKMFFPPVIERPATNATSVAPIIGKQITTKADAIAVVTAEIQRQGGDPKMVECSASKSEDGWRVTAWRICYPNNVGSSRFVPGGYTIYVVNIDGKIMDTRPGL